MSSQKSALRRTHAEQQFDAQQLGGIGAQVTSSLSYGFSLLGCALFKRVHDDVENFYGADSMLAPQSIDALHKMEAKTKVEIEVFQVAVSTDEASDRGYVNEVTWYRDWLARLRLGELADHPRVKQRLEQYLDDTREDCRLKFGDILARSARQASRAPLVLYRLFPLSVQIATNLAFGDRLAAIETSNRQIAVLPNISDCHECHGAPLENGEWCQTCGNPV